MWAQVVAPGPHPLLLPQGGLCVTPWDSELVLLSWWHAQLLANNDKAQAILGLLIWTRDPKKGTDQTMGFGFIELWQL